MKYNKLVRDKIPEYIQSKGGAPVWHIADADEYQQKLYEKLQEEVDEFLATPNAEELADILEVIEAIRDNLRISATDLRLIKDKKSNERGKFRKKIILDES